MSQESSRLVRELIDQHLQGGDALLALQRFASEFGWRPSDQVDRYAGTAAFSNGHLVVEHGFDRTAVISFLRSDTPYSELSPSDRRALLELSYNNLVDFHLLPEISGMRVVFTRTDPPQDQFFPATSTEDVWRADAFERLTGKRPNPNVKALDDALITTISFWKRAIQSDLGDKVTLSQISALMNSVILIRALEDYKNRLGIVHEQLLSTLLAGLPSARKNVFSLIKAALQKLEKVNLPIWLSDMLEELRVFDAWDSNSLLDLLSDFYRSKFSKYRYNFHLISKHALSRIYEHYVSLLRDDSSAELTLFKSLPEEVRNKDLGSVYTPQYVARFFARYIREHRTPRAFRSLATLDPACGSGMFLRTILEMQCDPTDDGFTTEMVRHAFGKTYGIDIDPNACQATRLSLALLHLVLADDFPETLNITTGESIGQLQEEPSAEYDLIIANPPFVKWDGLTLAVRERLAAYMLESGLGKQDLYLAFLKTAIKHTSHNGMLCFVLPHSFLLSNNAAALRQQLRMHFSVRVVADLSEVPVFEQTGVYVILIIAERISDRQSPATIVKCREFVGAALQDALNGRTGSRDGYDVGEVEQSSFDRERWNLLRPKEDAVRRAVESHSRLDSFVEIRQGLVTGLDHVFIRPSRECPKTERDIWIPLLPDREMLRFAVPERQATAVLMPFHINDERLTESELRDGYPATWAYLKEHRARLSQRTTVTKNGRPWWEPAWPRSRAKLLVPKIVTPHLVLLPRFGVDQEDKFAVSHSPYMVAKSKTGGVALLKISSRASPEPPRRLWPRCSESVVEAGFPSYPFCIR
jgi:hypothetical protein